jgi:hypothetical protein
MYEDSGCANPCGEEPMGCRGCPEFGNNGPAFNKYFYAEAMQMMEDMGIDMDDPQFDAILASYD